ncbi:hypothetical protein ASC95_23810 [Pelomonas sp. Root1217]|uniref:hypothetical protein n=1 Tax=Pelomonas sp. Root1217 TaxID=1736430 RepID=UPI00070F0716|nr:hypothetical protein [Pelomonas sp. Root1217]KQV47216.1 hypothetical protein ASC95_23810 [Pelomonas sp. Root1217]
MAKILAKFWLLRFLQVFVLACVVLGGIEALQHGGEGASYRSVLTWAALSALMTATVSAWWAYKRQCKLVFKGP